MDIVYVCYVSYALEARGYVVCPPMVMIGLDEVHLMYHIFLGLKIKLAIVGSMALGRGSRNPLR